MNLQQCHLEPTEVQQCKEVSFWPLHVFLLQGFSCSCKIDYERGYAETPFKTWQSGGCYKTLQQVVQSLLTCTLQSRHRGTFEIWRPIDYLSPCDFKGTLRSLCSSFPCQVQETSGALGLDFSNLPISKCSRDNTEQERGTSFSTQVNDLLLVSHLVRKQNGETF